MNKIRDKIQIFIYNKEKNRFLLFSFINNATLQKDNWFTLTKEIKEIRKIKTIIKKDIKDKTGLIVEDVFSLNWGLTYKLKNQEFKEMNFIAFIKSNKPILKDKNLKYKWVPMEKFIREINWKDNRLLLKEVLKKGINKEVYFDKKERDQ